jgi:hypothetical protein
VMAVTKCRIVAASEPSGSAAQRCGAPGLVARSR